MGLYNIMGKGSGRQALVMCGIGFIGSGAKDCSMKLRIEVGYKKEFTVVMKWQNMGKRIAGGRLR